VKATATLSLSCLLFEITTLSHLHNVEYFNAEAALFKTQQTVLSLCDRDIVPSTRGAAVVKVTQLKL